MSDPRDAWRHTGEPPPPEDVRNSDIAGKPAASPRPYSTPQSTIDAFWHVAQNESPESLVEWLARHPQDAPFLRKLAEERCTSQ
jgi:hypothetical protein